jgi:hypothetical protein
MTITKHTVPPKAYWELNANDRVSTEEEVLTNSLHLPVGAARYYAVYAFSHYVRAVRPAPAIEGVKKGELP